MASVAAPQISRPLLVKEDKGVKLELHLFCQHQKASVEECQELLAANPAAARKRDVYGRMVGFPIPWAVGFTQLCFLTLISLTMFSFRLLTVRSLSFTR